MAEILKSPETANTKDLVASISREILNPEMAACASSYESIDKKLTTGFGTIWETSKSPQQETKGDQILARKETVRRLILVKWETLLYVV